jgi:O-succinylbenzoate synthase
VRDVLLVQIIAGGGTIGWSECVAPVAPMYTSEYVTGAEHVLTAHLIPLLLAEPEVEIDGIPQRLESVRGHRMAKAALEMAVVDADLRRRGVSLAAYLGATRRRISVGVSVGMARSLPELLGEVERHLKEGYERVKLKIEPGWDVEPVRAVRRTFGDELLLQVDANGSYPPTELDSLLALETSNLLLIEQPFAAEQLAAHRDLASKTTTRICLDESIESAVTAADALDTRACSIVNLKAGRVGGIVESVAIHDLCRDKSAGLFCGGMLETGIGRAVNVALAALPGFTLPGDISASDRYYAQDVTEPFQLNRGEIAVPDRPGSGVELDFERIEHLTMSIRRIDR